MGRWKEAFDTLELYYVIRDSARTVETLKQIAGPGRLHCPLYVVAPLCGHAAGQGKGRARTYSE